MLRVLLSLALALAVGTVYAEDGKKKDAPKKPKLTAEQRFAEKDADKDGKVSLAEFKGKATKADQIEKKEKEFTALDTNPKDGFLSLEEFKAHAKAKKTEGKSDKHKEGGKKDCKKGEKKPENT